MERPVGLNQRRCGDAQHLPHGFLPRLVRDSWIQPPQGIPQSRHQHHLAKRIALRRRFARSHLRAVAYRITKLPEPRQGGVFDDGFGEVHKMGLNK